jgi:formaldehyde-activating enzyme involved in methanogenesis
MYEDDEREPSAYAIALSLLSQGAQPYCVVVDDELHVVTTIPTNKVSLAQMINRDGNIRDAYMVGVMKIVRDAVEEGALT